MSDPNREPDASVRHSGEQPPGMPRWVKVSMIIAGLLLLVLVVLKLTGAAGQHGPGMHQSAAQQWAQLPALPTVQSGSGT